MAVYTPIRLDQRQAAVADTTHYTVPAAKSAIIKEIVFCNTTNGQVAVWASLCLTGATVGDANRVISNEIIPANSTVSFTFSQVLPTGGFVSCKAAAASSVTVTMTGVEFA
jgi:hypothetical protein